MRSKVIGFIIGLGIVAGMATAASACAFHDQQAANAQQQTAQADNQAQTTTR